MTKAMALALTLGLVAVSGAEEPISYLEGGALILHNVPELPYSTQPPPEGWCMAYDIYGIDTWEEQNNRIDVEGYRPVVCFVLAAWLAEEKEWCGCEFGFDAFDPRIFSFADWGPCFPGAGLELPSAGWPGPLEGIALAASYSDPWMGNYLPVYYMAGYVYSYFGPGIVSLGPDPPTDFAGFSNCLASPEAWSAASLGGLGINTDGIDAIPVEHAIRACCRETSCTLMTHLECAAVGGWWLEAYDSCEPNPCDGPDLAACCIGGVCGCLTEEDCALIGGVWMPEFGDCGPPNPCIAVCCREEACALAREDECATLGGTWHPEWITCEPNPCIPVSVNATSWGRIRHMYER